LLAAFMMRSRTVKASATATPSMSSTRSPLRRPAAAAGPSGLTSPITGSLNAGPRPMAFIVDGSISRAPSRPSSSRVSRWPRPLRSVT
jgi:hypothetical protein